MSFFGKNNNIKVSLYFIVQILFFFLTNIFISQDSHAFFSNDMKFNSLSFGEEHASENIISFNQDKKGFLWVVTKKSLLRHDGFKFKNIEIKDNNHFNNASIMNLDIDNDGFIWIVLDTGKILKYDDMDKSFQVFSFESNNTAIYSSKLIKNKIWICTEKGLRVFDILKKSFLRDSHPFENGVFSSIKVFGISNEQNDTIYVATAEGIFKIGQEDFKVVQVKQDATNKMDYSSVRSIFFSSDNHLLIGSSKGMYYYDLLKNELIKYGVQNNDYNSISSDNITSIIELKPLVYGIATLGGGLNFFDASSGVFSKYQYSSENSSGLTTNNIQCLFKDEGGNVWIGGVGEICKISYNDLVMKRITTKGDTLNSMTGITSENVTTCFVDNQGDLWIGTNKGLNVKNSKTGLTSKYRHVYNDISSISDDKITTITQDKRGQVWIGTANGLCLYSKNNNSFVSFFSNLDDKNTLSSNAINKIYCDSKGLLWVGTNFGLNVYSPDKGVFQRFAFKGSEPSGLTESFISEILEDSLGNIWVGTNNGLNKIEVSSKKISHFRTNLSDSNKIISGNVVTSLCEDKNSTLWIATTNGLDRLNLIEARMENGVFQNIIIKHNNANTVKGVVSINDNVWISSNKGIIKINSTNGKVDFYNNKNGLPRAELKDGGIFLANDGELYFTSNNGLIFLDPKDTEAKFKSPQIQISEVKIGGKSFSFKNGITISYKESIINLEFALLDFTNPESNTFSYKLEGFDNEWVESGNRNFASYTNLKGGDYVFKIRGRNVDEEQVFEGSVSIFMETSPWKTKTAYFIYFLVLTIIVLSIIKLRAMAHEKEIRSHKIIIENLKKIDKMKDEFLANTTHELRTPLNGILGLAQSLIDGATGTLRPETANNIRTIIASSRRLLMLVNEIVDFSKMKQGDTNMDKRPVVISNSIDEIVNILKNTVKNASIDIINNVKDSNIMVFGDEKRIQQILYNIIGNGIKFTKEGYVKISGRIQGNYLEIGIEDTGIGIPNEKLQEIFKEFVQGDGSITREYGGTGLGLSISKKLIEIQGGSIDVKSEVGKGSVFTFSLPLFNGNLEEFESKIRTIGNPLFTELNEMEIETDFEIDKDVHVSKDKKLFMFDNEMGESSYKILVVDDEPINIQIFINNLSGYNNIELICAKDGFEALKFIEKNNDFDIILLDVMMPKMSGYELTKKIREKYMMFEMPILLLTAKDQPKDIEEGLSVGANDYLVKPFDKGELFSRIRNLMMLKKAVAKALINEKSFESEKKRRIISELLSDITRKMSTFLDEIEIINFLKTVLTDYIEFNKGFIILKTQDDYLKIIIKESSSEYYDIVELYQEAIARLYSVVNKSEDSHIFDNFFKGLTLSVSKISNLRSIYKAWHEVPIIFNNEFLGIICLQKIDYGNTFADDDVILKAMASQTAITIVNARLYGEIKKAASIDHLTNLLNRRSFLDIASKKLIECVNSEDDFAILMIDIDNFKKINDNYGHISGDSAIRTLSNHINNFDYKDKVVGRYGGEEFIIMLPNVQSNKKPEEVAEEIRAGVESLYFLNEDGERKSITISIGVASSINQDKEYGNLMNLIKHADDALYQAKHSGRNNVKAYASSV